MPLRQPFTLTDDMRAAPALDVIGDWDAPVEKAKRARDEDKLHLAVAKMLRVILLPSVVWWSCESRGVGNIEGGARKARGVVAGTPDIMIMWAGRTLFIELKTPKGTVSDAQKHIHTRLKDAGFMVHVCRSLDDVRRVLMTEAIPTRIAA